MSDRTEITLWINAGYKEKEELRDYNKIAGCLLGGAAGDALGYAIEFDNEKTIFSKYGEAGIQNFDLDFTSGEAIKSEKSTWKYLFECTRKWKIRRN